MKFETVRIYLVKRRFWFVVWSKNFATVATWHKDFSSLLAKTTTTTTTLHLRSTRFCTFLSADLVLHNYNVKLPNSFMLEIVVCAHQCFVMFLFTFFLHCRSFSPCWPLFLTFSQPISMFFEICYLFLSNALAPLSTSLKTLKFSRTCLCCWFFSLLSPDGLSI